MMLSCPICSLHQDQQMQDRYEIFRNDLWVLRHHPDPAPLLGWFLLDSRRHCSGPIEFTTAEATASGGAVQQASRLVQRLTQCDRVYAIAFGEGAQHLHLHLIPRVIGDPSTAAWSVADHYRAVDASDCLAADSARLEALVLEARRIHWGLGEVELP